MINPYFCYGAGFTTALLMYTTGWSDLYPSLSFSLLFFLIGTIVVHAALGLVLRKKKVGSFTKLDYQNDLAPWIVTALLYVLWSAEFFYEHGIPLFKILLRQPFDYKLFGIPTLHVFIVTFSSFYTIFLLHLFLSNRSLKIIFLYMLNLIAAILIYNRGMLLFNLSASAFLILVYQGGVSKKFIAWAAPSMVIILFLFGILGTLRVAHESGTSYTNEGFLKTGAASQRFRHSGVPPEFFWTYIYATSPLANLQNNISTALPPPLTLSGIAGWLNNEILFDFISKRINAYTGKTRAEQKNIPGPFNASTVYSGSYSYLGWTGLILMAIFILMLPLILIRIMPASSPFFLTALALLNTIFLFMVFENTVRFTGLSFQIMYPLFFHVAINRWPWMKRMFSIR